MGKQQIPSSSSFLVGINFIFLLLFISNLVGVEGFDSLLQLPRSVSRERTFDVTDFGAIGDGVTDDTQAFGIVWNLSCWSSFKSKIVIPAGKSFLVQPIDFGGPCQRQLTLRISGAIVAPKDPDLWESLDPLKWLYFHGVSHLNIEGRGIINGMGQEWWARSCKINTTNPCTHAPRALTFHRCNNLKVKYLTVLNSQQMHLAITNSFRVDVSHLKALAPEFSPNTDGIHISSSSHVDIKDSIIKTGDDCISIVGNSSRIKIRNIYCGPGHGISIGSLGKSNSSVKVHDVKVDEAFISNTENGVRIKTWQGGGGIVSGIGFKNIWMDNVSNPIIIDQYYCDSPVTCENQTLAVKVEDISFMGIKGTSATEEAMKFACSETYPCERLYLEDIELVSSAEGSSITSFCWEAEGSFSGPIYPPPCFLYNKSYIEQKVPSSSVLIPM